MKKRVAAAVLGIMLSVSMGLEVPAAALDSGFESGFTSEQAADVQTEDGAEAVQPSEDTEVPADTAAAEEQQVQESQDKEEHTDSENSGESTDGFFDGFTSGETVEENGSTAPVDGFEAVPEGTLDGTQEVQADNSDGVFDWKEWEQTADGFKLRKKKSAVSAAAEAQNVAGSDEIQAFDEVQENGEAAGTESVEAEGTTAQAEYYTAADGIVEITTRNEAGAVHTGSYLFDANGFLVTGIKTLAGTESANGAVGEFYFTASDSAQAYTEYNGQGAALVPWKTTLGQMKKDYWLWNKESRNFHYYGADGKTLTTAQLDEAAKANNTYTGYYKINDEYYCLDENGTPRIGDVTLTVNGVAAQYYFQPAETDQEIPGKMYRDGWKSFAGTAGEQWKYYDSGELDLSLIHI